MKHGRMVGRLLFMHCLVLLSPRLGWCRKLAQTGQQSLQVMGGFGHGHMSMASIESLVLAVSKEGATPALQPYLEQIEEMINASIDEMLLHHNLSQERMYQLNNTYDHCYAKHAEAGNLTAEAGNLTNLTELSEIHIDCRHDEATIKAEMEQACQLADDATANMWAQCNHFHDDINPINEHVPDICEEGNESNEEHAQRLRDWFQSRIDEWRNANSSCGHLTNLSKTYNDTCDEKTNTYSDKVIECDQKQNRLDVTACVYYQVQNCSKHQRCWDTATAAYMRENTTMAEQMETRKVEWRGLVRIRCLTRAIGASDSERHEEIEKCRQKTYDDSFLTLVFTYYAPPLTPELPTMPSCAEWDHSEDKLKPGTSEYMIRYYLPAPVEAPAGPCMCDCCTLCSFYDYCGEYPMKLNFQDIEGFSKDMCCQSVAWHTGEWREKCQTGCGHDEHNITREVRCEGNEGTPVTNTTLCGSPVPAELESCAATEECANCSVPCPSGQYRRGCDVATDAPGSCVHCTVVPGHYFTGVGGTTDSCPTEACDTSACGAGEYLDSCEGETSAGTCVACTPPDGYYFTSHGGLVDGSCVPVVCPDCPAGKYRVGCSGGTAGTCQACNDVDDGLYFTGPGTSADSCPSSQCEQNCPLAYHRQGCGNGSAGSCESCGLPDHTYAVSYGRLYDRCSSLACDPSRCDEGQYLDGCGGNSSGTCAPCDLPAEGFWYPEHGQYDAACSATACNNCTAGHYRSGCGNASGGTCVACTGLAADHYFSSHGGLSDVCPSERCADLPCSTGTYRKGCGADNISKGECVECDAPLEGVYFSGPGSLLPDSCPVASCNGSHCPVGTYLKKCGGAGNPLSAGICVQCSVPDEGFYFTGNGGLKNDCLVARCTSLPSCPAGQYRKGCGGPENPLGHGECAPCTNEMHGYYFSGDGGVTGICDASSCDDVGACDAGQYRHGCGVSPNVTSIGTCDTCNVPPEHYYIDSPGSNDNPDCTFEKCSDLESCPVAEYRLGCGGKDNPTSKGTCTSCPQVDDFYHTVPGGLDSNCAVESCMDLVCNTGEYREFCGGANTTSAGSCVSCSAPPEHFYFTAHGGLNDSCPTASCADLEPCATGQWREDCGGAANPLFTGRCAACSAPPDGFYLTGHGGIEDNCTVEACTELSSCPTGEYRDGCGSAADPTGHGLCLACSDPPNNSYISGHGGISDSCPTSTCDSLPSCDAGYYRTGCGGPGNATGTGYCAACTAPGEDFFLRGGGGLEDACSQEDCHNQPDCPVGEYRKNCGGPDNPTSMGACEACVRGKNDYGLPAGKKWTTHGGLDDSCEYDDI